MYLQHNNPNLLQDPIEDDEETVIINEDIINQIVEKFELTNLKRFIESFETRNKTIK